MRFLVLLFAACQCAPTAPPPQRSARALAPLGEDVHRGVCLAHSWEDGGRHGYGSETSEGTLDELHSLGANWVSLTPFGFMASLQDTHVAHVGERRGGEGDERVRAEIRAARERGLQTLLKPHLWIARGEWRAELDPADWTAWFASYREWILRYARMAAEEDVPILAIGTELRSSASHADEWRELIAAIREVYSGDLTYCANWDAVEDVPFWDAVDFMGVQFYAPLATTADSPAEEMSARLAEHLDALGAISQRVGRPVLLTEVGYKSTLDAAIRPYEWTERSESAVDEEAQAKAYGVLLRGVADRRWIRGLYIWKWFTNPNTREEGPRGFSPRGKRAEALLRQAFR